MMPEKNNISEKAKIKNHGVHVLAEQIAQLDVDDAEKSSYIAVQLIQALTEARSFNQLSSNLQVGIFHFSNSLKILNATNIIE